MQKRKKVDLEWNGMETRTYVAVSGINFTQFENRNDITHNAIKHHDEWKRESESAR